MLPGVNSGGPNDINADGVVTGISENGIIDSTTGLPEYDAVVWSNGQIINLGTFGGNWSYANALNDRGQVAGFALNTTPDSFNLGDFCMNGPFPTQMRALIWQNGVLKNLGTLGGPDSCALWINQSGQAAGHSFTNSTPNPTTGIPTLDPFLWDRRRMLDLGSLGGTFGLANWLNNRGQVVGQSNLAGDLTAHPFLWDRGSLKDLGTLGGSFGVATSVSDAGAIVGGATNQNDQAFLAFVWKNGVMTNLETLQGDDCSLATNVNSGGQIVGFSFPCAGGPSHAFLWERGSLIDLNTFVPLGSDLQLTEATFIDDRGEITVQGVLPNGDTRAVLLIPDGQDETLVSATHASTVTRQSLTPGEIMAAVRARLGKRYHIPSLGASPRD
jgi:probable HAF family extracellular repeat protein